MICAAISPYRATRNEARKMVGENFIEVFVDTPIEVCEQRDVKGLYARARRGQITGFTGVDDPYEAPVNPEITLDTVNFDAAANARKIIAFLEERGYVLPVASMATSTEKPRLLDHHAGRTDASSHQQSPMHMRILL